MVVGHGGNLSSYSKLNPKSKDLLSLKFSANALQYELGGHHRKICL